ncbi:MAG: carboxypeptidase regulatory-like domain-containing protein [Gemmatimonadaceae bacterium]
MRVRSASVVAIWLLAVAAVLLGATASAAAQSGTYTVSGMVRGSVTDEPLAGAVVDLRTGSAQRFARTDQFGAFELASVPSGNYRMTVRRIGFAELARDFVVADRDTAVTLTLVPRAQLLDTTRVRANAMAIHGVVGAAHDLRPLAGATVLVVGAGRTETTDSAGQFFAPVKKPGTYFLRIARPGYAMQVITIDVPDDRSVETSALLDSSEMAVRPGTDELWTEFDKRVVWHAMNSAVVSGADLRKFEADLLSDALRSTPSFVKRGLKIGSATCVFVNGLPRPGWALDAVPVDNIEAVELYGAGGDLTESLRKDWPRGVPCGEATGLRNAGRAAPGTVNFAVIWMKQ